jgi:putative ABC transport system permease protein
MARFWYTPPRPKHIEERMLKNILITSLRNFFRNRSFSLINLIGLSISMSLAMLIIMIIRDQFAFDNFHQDSDRIYRVNTKLNDSDWGIIDFASAPLPMAQALSEYAFTEEVVRVNRQLYGDATFGNVSVPLKGLIVDPSFVTIFNFPLSKGDAESALDNPNSLILTHEAAQKMFGSEDPIGKTISISKFGEFTITGVLAKLKGKTHFEFEVLCSASSLPIFEKDNIINSSVDNWSAYYDNYVYLKLKDDQSIGDVEKALQEINKVNGVGLKSMGKDITYDFYLQPLEKITPGPELSGTMGRGLPAFMLIFLGVLAAIVLVMSIFNFTNLTIAKSLSRAREIGVRKVVGAKRSQVFGQFIAEAVIFSLIALSFSYVLLQVLKDGFLKLSFNSDFSIGLQEDVSLYMIFIVFAVIVGILAGILPASYLSAFKPSRVLKDVQNVKVYSRLTFRKILMVSQFTLSIIFVVVVLVVYRQVDFMLSSDYGIDQSNNLNIRLKGITFEKLANDIRSIPGVERVGGVSHKLGTWEDNSAHYKRNKNDKSAPVRHFMVDHNYLKNISLKFVAGKNFNPDEQTTSEKHVILNETFVRQFGFESAHDAIGETIYADDSISLQIIGVVKDFHFRPLTNQIGPLALRYNLAAIGYLNAKIHSGQKASVLASLNQIWKRHDPTHPIDYMMMEDEIDDAYRQSGMKDMVVIVSYITFLVISLACLGMLGMAMYSSQVRAKEVSIRKIMGASAMNVVMLLSHSFLILIAIAMLIGVPVSFITSEVFLQDFAYRIQITPLLIGTGIMIIAVPGLGIVWSQTIRIATSNPVNWIRNE